MEIITLNKRRFTFEAPNLPSECIRDVKIDYARKKIFFRFYEAVAYDTLKSLDHGIDLVNKIPDFHHYQGLESELKTLILTTFSPEGQVIYTCSFMDCKKLSDIAHFDYQTNEDAYREVTVRYGSIVRVFNKIPDNKLAKPNTPDEQFKKHCRECRFEWKGKSVPGPLVDENYCD